MRPTSGVLITTVLLSLCAPASAQNVDLAIEHQGVARRAILHTPPSASGKLPLIIYLHGKRPENWKNHTLSQLDTVADRDGVLTAYPEAIGFAWNYMAGLGDAQKTGETEVDDVGFIARLIDQLIAAHSADPAHIYVQGDSRGGLTVVCRLAEKIAAAGAYITGMTDRQIADCKPGRVVSLMAVGGANDFIQFYDGELNNSRRLLSVPETMEFWRVRHGCTGQTFKSLPHRLSEDTTRILLIEWTGCATEGAVRLYRVNGGGHQVPTFAPGDPEWIKQAGRLNHDIETAEEFWAFAKKFSLVH
jgi:polyhydroxybutyrate depolymerase